MRSKIGSGLYWILLVVGLVGLLSACGGSGETPVAELVPGQVTVNALQVVPSGSAPVQVQATIGGIINDSCTLVVGVNSTRDGNTFTLTPQTTVNNTGACTAVQIPFTQQVSLDVLNLPAGTYTVNAGTVSQLFSLSVDNVAAAGGDGVTTTNPAGEAATTDGAQTATQDGGQTQAAGTTVNQPANGLFSMTQIYFIALDDNGQNGTAVGCNDSLVPVTITLDPPTPAVMTAAYTRLLSIKDQTYNNYYNPLFQSDLKLDTINIVNREALVYLTGTWNPPEGDCIEAQMRAQLRQTALQYSTVDYVTIWLNGRLLDPSGLG